MFKIIILVLLSTQLQAQEDSIVIPQSLIDEVENGHAESAYFIATQFDKKSYENEKFYVKAKHWMQKAADMGYPQAMYELARMFDSEELEVSALEWFLKASEFGHSDAIYSVATYYLLGFSDTPSNCIKAYSWYEKAQSKDNIVSFNDHAWSLATSVEKECRNPERALRIFSHVKSYYSINNETMPLLYLDTQAAVHAGVADFNKAIELQKTVVKDMSQEDPKQKAYFDRLNSYKKRQAWIQQQ